MSEKNTAESTSKRSHEKSSSGSKHSPHSSPSKHKKTESNQINKKSSQEIPISPKVNGKLTKSHENGNAAPSQGNAKKYSQSVKPNQIIIGTPTKHKLVERTNSVDVSSVAALKNKQVKKVSTVTANAYSPRKTRSKATRNGDAIDVPKVKTKLKLPQLDGADDVPLKRRTKAKVKSRSKKSDGSDSDDSDFAPAPPKKIKTPVANKKPTPKRPVNKALARAKQIDRRVFSTDEELEEDTNPTRMNFWIEAYAEKEKKWVVIDPVKKKVDCVDHVRVSLPNFL